MGFSAHAEKLYLYDGGVLLATFDGTDNVIDLYVNGPTGRLATYYQNNTNQLYYYLNDHLGSVSHPLGWVHISIMVPP